MLCHVSSYISLIVQRKRWRWLWGSQAADPRVMQPVLLSGMGDRHWWRCQYKEWVSPLRAVLCMLIFLCSQRGFRNSPLHSLYLSSVMPLHSDIPYIPTCCSFSLVLLLDMYLLYLQGLRICGTIWSPKRKNQGECKIRIKWLHRWMLLMERVARFQCLLNQDIRCIRVLGFFATKMDFGHEIC